MPNPRGRVEYSGTRAGRGQRDSFKIDTSSTSWQSRGKCATACTKPGCEGDHAHADDWFDGFGWDDKQPADEPVAIMRAHRLCAGCPVPSEICAGYALDNKLEHGVFGGLTPAQRTRYALNITIAQKGETA